MPDPTAAASNATEPPRQCRSLTIDGTQCQKPARRGEDLCSTHLNYRRRVTQAQQPDKFAVPLLENHAAIRFMLSKILQDLLAGELAPDIAGKSIYCCQVAASTLPRPTAPATQAASETHLEPVVDTVPGPDGEPLGPLQPYLGPTGAFEPTWSISKYMYEEECARLGRPKPTCAADMPLSGWLTPEEMKEDPDAFTARYHARIKELLKKNPPPPRPPDCPFGFDWCGGPAASHHCNRCQLLIEDRAARAATEAAAQSSIAQPAAEPGKVDLQAVAADPAPEPLPERFQLPHRPGLSEPQASRMAPPAGGRGGLPVSRFRYRLRASGFRLPASSLQLPASKPRCLLSPELTTNNPSLFKCKQISFTQGGGSTNPAAPWTRPERASHRRVEWLPQSADGRGQPSLPAPRPRLTIPSRKRGTR